jgi:hypothetical protein
VGIRDGVAKGFDELSLVNRTLGYATSEGFA